MSPFCEASLLLKRREERLPGEVALSGPMDTRSEDDWHGLFSFRSRL